MENIKDKIIDTDYTKIIKDGGYVNYTIPKKESIIDKIVNFILPKTSSKKQEVKKENIDTPLSNINTIEEKIEYILKLPDEEYSDKLLTSDLRREILKIEEEFLKVRNNLKYYIAPSSWEHNISNFNISGLYGLTFYVAGYPSFLNYLWIRRMLSFDAKWDLVWFIYPKPSDKILVTLKNKLTQLKAELSSAIERGVTIDISVEQEYQDLNEIREKISRKEESFYEVSHYINVYGKDQQELDILSRKIDQIYAGEGINIKRATYRMDEGFFSSVPLCIDDLGITRGMITSSLGASFPFISSDLIENEGIFYGINRSTGSVVIFDRFSKKFPNANEVVLAQSGGGKSFYTKLQILRYLLHGVEVIVIDPENEYKSLIDKVGGTYINVSGAGDSVINPFDLPEKIEDVDYKPGDLLRTQILSLISFINILVGGLTPEEETILDKALQTVYAIKEITYENESVEGKTLPLMEDLVAVLEGMAGGDKIATRLYKYVSGTFGKLFNSHTNVKLDTGLTIFSIRDLEDSLKTPAMYNILNFIWGKVRAKKRKRLLVVDESWIMMKSDISASFLFGLIKRARKYGLGVTTITQDIEDFVKSNYGKPIVSNSSIAVLLRQSPASIKMLENVLNLSDREKEILVSSGVGEGILIAGNQHLSIKIVAGPFEEAFIRTDNYDNNMRK